jgi:Ca-activated chloride channel family protein
MFTVALALASLPVPTNLTAQQPAPSDNLVLMNVTVTNSKNIYERNKGTVSGLGQEAFTVYDDKVPQEIALFTNEDVPASVAIVADTSGSMITQRGQDISMRTVASALSSFIEHSNRSDEYFLVTFGDSYQLSVDWTGDGASIVNSIASVKPKGGGALYDACYFSLDKVSHGKYRKHVLLVLTTGRYARSKHSYKELRDQLRGSDALLYILDPPNTSSFLGAPTEIQELPKDTGGRYLYSANQSAKLLALHAELIALEIRHQYTIGFVPKDSGKGHNWHSLTVKVNAATNAPRELQQLFTRSRSAYRATNLRP